MRKTSLLLCLMMVTFGFAGCLNGNTPVTDEGDPVILGESPDDWPTYYVATSADLPTCDSTTLGRLYYVEADTNFQACTSTGWTVIQIGGSSVTGLLNTPPVLTASIWGATYFVDDGDGTWTKLVYIDWFAMDLDGTIASLGIDYDGDGAIDITLTENQGILSDEPAPAGFDGDGAGAFHIPLEIGNSVSQVQEYWGQVCSLLVTKTLIVMATDDAGATTYHPMTIEALEPRSSGYFPLTINQAIDSELITGMALPQSDVDWLTGVSAGSPCPALPQLTVTDHPDTLTAASEENVVVVTVDDPGAWSDWVMSDWGTPYLQFGMVCDDGSGADWDSMGYLQTNFTFSGTDMFDAQAGDTFTLSEAWDSNCPTGITDVIVYINFNEDGLRFEFDVAVS